MNHKMDTDHCYHHGYEPIPADCYRVCGECGHAYATAEELLARTNELLADIARHDGWMHQPEIDPEAIHTCPLCTHDF